MPSMIVRLPNHLGDACMATAALDLLAARGHALTLVGRPWARDLFAGYPWQMVPLATARLTRVRQLHRLRRELPRGTPALLLTNSFSSALEFRLAGLRPVGYDTDGRGWLLTRSFQVPARRPGIVHMIDYYHGLARSVIDRPVPSPALIELRLMSAAHEHARRTLSAAGVRLPYVMLCPLAVGLHHGKVKAWDGFARLCHDLLDWGQRVVACPGPGELEAVAAAVPGACLLPPTDLATFGALLALSRLVVANDSGPGHLAAAVGARLISVFGVTDPAMTQPRGPRVQRVGSGAGWPGYDDVWSTVQAELASG